MRPTQLSRPSTKLRLYPDKLAAHLQQQCLPVYVVSGDETLLVEECSDLIRAAARKLGCSKREVLDAGEKTFDWQELLNCSTDMSLFDERKLIELRIPSGKPGAEGSKAINAYLERSSGDDVLLVISGKIDKQSLNSKWFKALDSAGAYLQLWEVKAHELPRWLQQRLGTAGLSIDQDALELLSERLEGNLLAAVQEVEKLKLLAENQHLDLKVVSEGVLDNARYNLFAMTDAALKGDASASLRMLHGLRDEGTEAMVILWALTRELRSLYDLKLDCERGQSVQQAMQARRVWSNRQGLMQSALARHSLAAIEQLMLLAAKVDGSIKGYAEGRVWDHLDQLVTALAGK